MIEFEGCAALPRLTFFHAAQELFDHVKITFLSAICCNARRAARLHYEIRLRKSW